MKRIVAAGCLATTLLGLLGIAACGDDEAAGAAAPIVEAGTAAPDATAPLATAPVITIVNDLTGSIIDARGHGKARGGWRHRVARARGGIVRR